jgi:hypothetical protein
VNYDLPAEPRPDYAIELPARYAVALLDATRLAVRMLEITASANQHSATHRLGVLVGREQLFGRIDVTQPTIPSPVELSEFGGHLHLAEQRAIASQFRKAFSGPVRQALAIAREAFGHPAVYAVFTEPGMVFLPLSNKTPGRRRIACVTCRDAATMEEERACVRLNQASVTTFRFLREALWEIQSREIDEDETLQEDMLAFRPGPPGAASAPPRAAPPPPNQSPEPFEFDDAPPPPDDFPAGPSLDDEEDLIDGEVIDLADPTDVTRPPPPDDYRGDDGDGPDDMDMTATPF